MTAQLQVVIVDGAETLTPADKGAMTRLLKTSTVKKAFAVVGPEEFTASMMAYLEAKKQMAKIVDAGNSKKVAQIAEALITFTPDSSTYAWAKKHGLQCFVRKS